MKKKVLLIILIVLIVLSLLVTIILKQNNQPFYLEDSYYGINNVTEINVDELNELINNKLMEQYLFELLFRGEDNKYEIFKIFIYVNNVIFYRCLC